MSHLSPIPPPFLLRMHSVSVFQSGCLSKDLTQVLHSRHFEMSKWFRSRYPMFLPGFVRFVADWARDLDLIQKFEGIPTNH